MSNWASGGKLGTLPSSIDFQMSPENGFIQEYLTNSRYQHESSWKNERLQDFYVYALFVESLTFYGEVAYTVTWRIYEYFIDTYKHKLFWLVWA